jgi:hypothetical protein
MHVVFLEVLADEQPVRVDDVFDLWHQFAIAHRAALMRAHIAISDAVSLMTNDADLDVANGEQLERAFLEVVALAHKHWLAHGRLTPCSHRRVIAKVPIHKIPYNSYKST